MYVKMYLKSIYSQINIQHAVGVVGFWSLGGIITSYRSDVFLSIKLMMSDVSDVKDSEENFTKFFQVFVKSFSRCSFFLSFFLSFCRVPLANASYVLQP
jgi:hypothetical protein